MSDIAFSLRNIVKDFPGVRALDDATLSVRAGEVHGLVGENGAGKSTIIKVLAGVYRAESGHVEVEGEILSPVTPESAHAAGIRFIHQELHLVPHFTILESVFMGQELNSPFGLKQREMRRATETFLHDVLNLDIPASTLIRDIGTAERKLVQIARALIDGKARVVVFDEPTAPLASEDTDRVMKAIRGLKQQGIAILYVSHYLNEIVEICDRVTVFRHGRNVAALDSVGPDSGTEMVSAMVGRDLGSMFPQRAATPGTPMLTIEAFGDGTRFHDVSFSVAKGEILGIAGLIGSGREELIDALYGLRRAHEGRIMLDGTPVRIRSAAHAVRRGMVLVPRDRRHDGLVLPMTIAENVTLATLEQTSTFGIENRRRAGAATRKQIEALDIRPPDPRAVTRFLSGGNQQKVVLGRWLARQARVVLFDEPTVGVDVGARVEIYQLMANLARDGAAIVVSSSDPAELVGLCDRIAVMMRGRIIEVLPAGELSVDRLVAVTTGAEQASEAADVDA